MRKVERYYMHHESDDTETKMHIWGILIQQHRVYGYILELDFHQSNNKKYGGYLSISNFCFWHSPMLQLR